MLDWRRCGYDDHLGASVLRAGYVLRKRPQPETRAGRAHEAGRVLPALYEAKARGHGGVAALGLLRLNLEGLCLHATALRVMPSQ